MNKCIIVNTVEGSVICFLQICRNKSAKNCWGWRPFIFADATQKHRGWDNSQSCCRGDCKSSNEWLVSIPFLLEYNISPASTLHTTCLSVSLSRDFVALDKPCLFHQRPTKNSLCPKEALAYCPWPLPTLRIPKRFVWLPEQSPIYVAMVSVAICLKGPFINPCKLMFIICSCCSNVHNPTSYSHLQGNIMLFR